MGDENNNKNEDIKSGPVTMEQLTAMEERLNEKIEKTNNAGCLFFAVIIILSSIWGIERTIDNINDKVEDIRGFRKTHTVQDVYEKLEQIEYKIK